MQLVGSLCKRHAVASRLRPLVNERFQVLFHSPPGVLPTFPSRYWSTIGLPGIFSLAAWSPQFQTGFLVSRPTQVASASQPRYPYGTFTLSGPTFQTVPVPGCSAWFRFLAVRHSDAPTTPHAPKRARFGLLPFRSPLLRESIFLSPPAGTKMFQFPAYAQVSRPVHGLQPCGFPHSDTPGSLPVCGSPGLFAAYHVLPRFRKPRHPPFALLLFLVLSW